MKKKITLILGFLICITFATYGQSYAAFIEDDLINLFQRVSSEEVICIGTIKTDNELLSERIQKDISRFLSESGYAVVNENETDYLEEVLEKQFLSGLYDYDSLPEIGDMLGASYLLTGRARNLVDHYWIILSLYNLEQGTEVITNNYEIAIDNDFENILSNNHAIGSQAFALGVSLGAAYGFSNLHEDMVGEGPRPAEENAIPFVGMLSLSYKGLSWIHFETGLNFYVNTGVDVKRSSSSGNTLEVRYSTLDIPLGVSIPIIKSPINMSLKAGGYISFPLGKLKVTYLDEKIMNSLVGYVWGISTGIEIGVPVSIGEIIINLGYYNDFDTFRFHNTVDDSSYNVCYRKVISLLLGYKIGL